MAALGAPPDGFWTDWLLRRLIDLADRRALPAFERWASYLDTGAAFIQGVGSCYVVAMEGCAQFLETPPQLEDRQSLDEEAWQCYGEMVFWLHRPGLADEDIAEHCAPLWRRLSTQLAPAAANALYWFSQPDVAMAAEGKPILHKLITVFREELCNILEWSLDHRDSLTSIFGPRGQGLLLRDHGGIADYIIDILGYVGNADTVELLRGFVDDPILGLAAIKSIRRLTEGRV